VERSKVTAISPKGEKLKKYSLLEQRTVKGCSPARILKWRSVEDCSLLEFLSGEVLKITPCWKS
jgi:hypothetical protein